MWDLITAAVILIDWSMSVVGFDKVLILAAVLDHLLLLKNQITYTASLCCLKISWFKFMERQRDTHGLTNSQAKWVNYFFDLFLTLTTSDISLSSVFNVTLFEHWRGAKKESKGRHGAVIDRRHRWDPHRDVLLTLTVQSKGQGDVTGIWAGYRQTEHKTSEKTSLDMSKSLSGLALWLHP